MRSDKGLTLIMVVVTIIVMLILAGTSLYFTFNGGIVNRAVDTRFKTEVSSLLEQWNMKRAELEMKGVKTGDMNYELIELLNDIKIAKMYNSKLRIENGLLVFIPSQCSDEEEEILEDMRIYASAIVE